MMHSSAILIIPFCSIGTLSSGISYAIGACYTPDTPSKAELTTSLTQNANCSFANITHYGSNKGAVVVDLSGLMLLVAMIGTIVLTLRHRQDVLAQMYRDPSKAMELKGVKPVQEVE